MSSTVLARNQCLTVVKYLIVADVAEEVSISLDVDNLPVYSAVTDMADHIKV